MGVLKIKASSARDTNTLVSMFETVRDPKVTVSRLGVYLNAIATGTESALSSSVAPQIVISVQDSEVQASGTVTVASAIATNTVTINGVTFTGVNSGATGNQFNIGGSNSATATNIATAINASTTALISGYVTASASGAVVTITSAFYGTAGNMTTLASSGSTLTVSGARLTGGAADASALTLNF